MSAPTVTMREPRLIAETAAQPTRRRAPDPALPNLVIVKPVGRWPVGEVVAKGAFPCGFEGHLEMGAVAETDRPVTHESALSSWVPVPASGPDQTAEVNRLRAIVADYEGRLAALQTALTDRDRTVATLRSDLVAAEELVASLSVAKDRVEAAGSTGGLVAHVATPGGGAPLPVAAPPWKG